MAIEDDMMKVLKKHANMEDSGYINPNFLFGITELLYKYYQIEDDVVDAWISDMWSR